MQFYPDLQHVFAIFFGAVLGVLTRALLLQFHQHSFWAAVQERQVVEQRTATLTITSKEVLPRNALCSVLVIHFKLEASTSCKMLFKDLAFFVELA